mmetsp:Transcript_38234/g.69944  ORF Transcript_38234/g.69944 Transcript_38234/m.69944 type:complete len:86 (-) Transcript_38234:598-855(-)
MFGPRLVATVVTVRECGDSSVVASADASTSPSSNAVPEMPEKYDKADSGGGGGAFSGILRMAVVVALAAPADLLDCCCPYDDALL